MNCIKKYLETRVGNYSFYFEDLRSGYSYGYNENVSMTAAGCMKLPIAISLIKAVEDKRANFMDKIKVLNDEKVYGTGIIHEFDDRDYTLFELMVIMLIQSDNTAANKIIDILGMEQINEDIKSMELKNTKLNRKTADERMLDVNIENMTSAYDLCMMWKHLYNGTFLNKENGQMLIDILERQQIKNKLALYIQDDLKSEISKLSVENDTEYIHNEKGNFTFTVLSEKVPNSVYGTITLAKCGKMMWDEITNNWS